MRADELTNYFTGYPYADYFNELAAIDNLPQQAYSIRNNPLSDRVVGQYMHQLIDKLRLLPGQKKKYPKMTPVEFMKEMRTIKCISPKMKAVAEQLENMRKEKYYQDTTYGRRGGSMLAGLQFLRTENQQAWLEIEDFQFLRKYDELERLYKRLEELNE